MSDADGLGAWCGTGLGGATVTGLVFSWPLQLATTMPVISAVANTTAIPIAVTFHGFRLSSVIAASSFHALQQTSYTGLYPTCDHPF
jgi:hypothetical protein